MKKKTLKLASIKTNLTTNLSTSIQQSFGEVFKSKLCFPAYDNIHRSTMLKLFQSLHSIMWSKEM
jgi:hypothetical protein